MSRLFAIASMLLALSGAAATEQVEPAASLRLALDAVTKRGSSQDFRALMVAFPESFVELKLLVSGGDKPLRERGPRWDFNEPYIKAMCEAYRYVDHEQYLRKLLRIGREAGSWGGPEPRDGQNMDEYDVRIAAGDAYRRLFFGTACEPFDPQAFSERLTIFYSLVSSHTDSDVRSIFESLSWDGADRVSVNWMLDGLCAAYPSKCTLTRSLASR